MSEYLNVRIYFRIYFVNLFINLFNFISRIRCDCFHWHRSPGCSSQLLCIPVPSNDLHSRIKRFPTLFRAIQVRRRSASLRFLSPKAALSRGKSSRLRRHLRNFRTKLRISYEENGSVTISRALLSVCTTNFQTSFIHLHKASPSFRKIPPEMVIRCYAPPFSRRGELVRLDGNVVA